jgi:hypothetical protein
MAKYAGQIDAVRHMLFNQYKRSAKRGNRNYDFNLSFDQFVDLLEAPCSCCNRIKANTISYNKKSLYYSYNGVDRINNELGYELSNVQTLCGLCNWAKRNLDSDVFSDWILSIANKLKADGKI